MISTGGSRDFAFKCMCISVLSMVLWQCSQWSSSVLQLALFCSKTRGVLAKRRTVLVRNPLEMSIWVDGCLKGDAQCHSHASLCWGMLTALFLPKNHSSSHL